MSKAILIPLINANEPEALLAGLHVKEGQYIKRGEVLCTLETTKSIEDVLAEDDGYLVGLNARVGTNVRAGEILGYLADRPDEIIPDNTIKPLKDNLEPVDPSDRSLPMGLRITQPALAFARQINLDLSSLPTDTFITEDFIRSYLVAQMKPSASSAPVVSFDPTAIIVYGGGGHGKSVIELIQALRVYRIAGVIDDGMSPGDTILGAPVLGGQEKLSDTYAQGVRLSANAVGGIGNVAIRKQVFQRLAAAGFACPALVHPTAYVEPSACLSAGVQVFPHAYIGSDARLGFGCIANTGAIISHDCELGDFVNISPGAILAGEVHIASDVLVGMGVTINLRVKIGEGARIGNGATVKNDVPTKAIVRAGSVWLS